MGAHQSERLHHSAGPAEALGTMLDRIYTRLPECTPLIRRLPADERAKIFDQLRKPLSELGNSPDDNFAVKSLFLALEPMQLGDVVAAIGTKIDGVSKAWGLALDALELRIAAAAKSPRKCELFELETTLDVARKAAGSHAQWQSRLGKMAAQIDAKLAPMLAERSGLAA